jgi:hypothetical protein
MSQKRFSAREKVLDKRNRLYSHHVESFSASDILTAHRVIAPNHITLCLGEACLIAVVGPTRQLCLLSSHHPLDLILSLLPTMGTGHHMCTLLWPFIKKVALFHAHLIGPGEPFDPRLLCHPA